MEYDTKQMQYDSANKISAIQSKTAAAQAKMEGNYQAMEMQASFNQTMASNAVMSAAQGRSGGSVAGIARASESQLQWDLDFTKLSSDIKEGGYEAQAAMTKASANPYEGASSMALIGGISNAVVGSGMQISQSLYKIGGE